VVYSRPFASKAVLRQKDDYTPQVRQTVNLVHILSNNNRLPRQIVPAPCGPIPQCRAKEWGQKSANPVRFPCMPQCQTPGMAVDKRIANLACSSSICDNWSPVLFGLSYLYSASTVKTSGQFSPVLP